MKTNTNSFVSLICFMELSLKVIFQFVNSYVLGKNIFNFIFRCAWEPTTERTNQNNKVILLKMLCLNFLNLFFGFKKQQ